MENYSSECEFVKTKHCEYSLIPATFLILSLPLLFSHVVSSSFLLWLIIGVGAATLIGNSLSIYRHLDVLVHRFCSAYGLMLSTIVTNMMFVGLVELLILTAPLSSERILRENMFYLVVMLFGGIMGSFCFCNPRKKSVENDKGILDQYFALLFVVTVLLFILPRSFFEAGLSKLQLVIVIFFCLVSYGSVIFYQLKEGGKILFFENEDVGQGAFSIGRCSPFSKAWHAGWLVIHFFAFFSVLWVLSPYLRQTLGVLPQAPQWLGIFGAGILIFPFGAAMFIGRKEGKSIKAMILGIFYLLVKMSLGIPAVIGIAIWLDQGIILAFSLPQTILVLSNFLLFGLLALVFRDEGHQKIIGLAHFGILIGSILILC